MTLSWTLMPQTTNLDDLVNSKNSPLPAGGDEGEGDRNLLKIFYFHPHPQPLQSRERGL
jgi:hypothetical protein